MFFKTKNWKQEQKQKQLLIWLGKKLLIKLQNSQEIHHRMVQKQLKIKQKALDLIEKYQKKDIADKITKLSRSSPQNNSETVESKTKNNGFDRKIPKERYIKICLSKKMIKIIDDLGLI